MKCAIQIFAVLCVGSLTGCSTPKMKITADHYAPADFASYKSYDWIPFPDKEKADPRLNYDFLGQAIPAAADTELQKKGYVKLTTGQPDFRVGWYVAVDQGADVQHVDNFYGYTAGAGWGYGPQGGWTYAGGLSSSYVRQYAVGTLVLDIVDGKSNKLVWRGAAHAQINPKASREQKEERINAAIQKILEQFPPQEK